MQQQIDENLYSRQIGTYGAETMGKLIKMKVFLQGLRGLGAEVAKNLILAGPAQVVLHDQNIVQIQDLSSNFYLNTSHIEKKTRSEASLPSLQDLNTYVQVSVHKENITKEFLQNFDVIVFTEFFDKNFLQEINNYCRLNQKGFIYGGILGLYGFTFVDFGQNFTCFDTNGEQTKPCLVSGISQDEKGLVILHEDKRHPFYDGDYVTFKEVQGMTEVNNKQFKVISGNSFQIGDTRNFGTYEREGICEQIKVPTQFQFKSFEESLINPYAPDKNDMDNCDFMKFGIPEILHFFLNALFLFYEKKGNLPQLNNIQDSIEYLEIIKYLNQSQSVQGEIKIEAQHEEIAKNISLFARAQISPLCSFWGGIVCQEIIKFTGKYTPLRQWLHYEVFEALPKGKIIRNLQNSRYDDLIAIFGNQIFENLQQQQILLVGAGALGCEFLKMLSLMGVSCGKEGKLFCTDDDNIAISNLNRQFLFRKQDVGHNKSQKACQAVEKINNELKYQSLQLQVGPQNETFFNDEFWDNLTCVINAVDNVKARLYIDSRCVFYKKPLLESGTLGPKCNVQIILPYMTQPYGDSQDPPEESIPLCTLKNFPYQIEHTIQWARDYFEGTFVEAKKSEKELKQQNNAFIQRLEATNLIAQLIKDRSLEKCVFMSCSIFQDIFHDMILQMLHTFPLDSKTTEGTPFWTGQKRSPQAIIFDINDSTHINFIKSSTNIFCNICQLPYCNDEKILKQIIQQYKPTQFIAKSQNVESKDQNNIIINHIDDDEKLNKLKQDMVNYNYQNSNVNCLEFEKDDDSNFHIDFISATANLRARNYKIPEIERFKIKMIAGKIIPAIATTTAMAVGAVGIELLKIVQQKPVEFMKNSFMSLAVPLWIFSEPIAPSKAQDKDYDEFAMGPIKAVPQGFTSWDSITVTGPLNLQQFIDYFFQKYEAKISIISCGQTCMYNKYIQNQEMQNRQQKIKRLKMDFQQLYEFTSQNKFPLHKKYMEVEVSASNIEEVDLVMPSVRYQVKQ